MEEKFMQLALVGVVLFILGIVLVTGILDWLLDVTGVLLIAIGVIMVVMGFFSRNKSSDF